MEDYRAGRVFGPFVSADELDVFINIMTLDTKKILKEVNKNLLTMEKIFKCDKEFKNIHKEILNLCKLIFNKTLNYKKIDIEYPNQIIIILDDLGNDELPGQANM